MDLRRKASCAISIALAAAVPTGSAAWESHIEGAAEPTHIVEMAHQVAVDSNGDVVALGDLLADSANGPNFGVVKLSGVTGEQLWRHIVEPSPMDRPAALGLDATGDVFVAGSTEFEVPDVSRGRFAVFKLAGTDGALLWSSKTTGTAIQEGGFPGFNLAEALAVDAAGDVVAAGILENAVSGVAFAVLKFSGATGDELWHVEIDGSNPSSRLFQEVALAVVVDSVGDVFAAGGLFNLDTGGELLAVKLSGSDGTELWRREGDGSSAGGSLAWTAAVDGDGNVLVAGELNDLVTFERRKLLKLSGRDGSTIWQVDTGVKDEVVVGPGGVIAVAGDSTVALLEGDDGEELWRTDVGFWIPHFSPSLAFDSDGNVLVVGIGDSHTFDRLFVVAKLARADGSEIWRHTARSPSELDASAWGVAVDSLGDVFAGGRIGWETGSFAVVKLRGADGANLQPISGRALRLLDRADDPARRKLKLSSADRRALLFDAGGLGDPTVSGATLEILNPNTGESASVALPASQWATRGSRGFVYRDASRAAGPCRSVSLRAGRKLGASCFGQRIGFTLDEPAQDVLVVRLSIGPAQYCMSFGGNVSEDSTSSGSPRGFFKARDAGVPASCPFSGP
jgi:outer membrane protein assembly factor BamB